MAAVRSKHELRPMRREVARFGPCVSLRDLTGLDDGSGICDADEIRRNGSDEADGSQWFSFSVPFPNHFWTGSGNTPWRSKLNRQHMNHQKWTDGS